MTSILEQFNTQQALINAIVKYLQTETTKTRNIDRATLIDKCTWFVWAIYREDGFSREQVIELTKELLARIETEDHGWFIDLSGSTGDKVKLVHSQHKESIEINRINLLLPFNLFAIQS